MRHTILAFAAVALLVLGRVPPTRASALLGDVNGDCSVNVLDLSMEAQRFLTGIGSLLYSPTFDLNQDGVINILDMQIIAAHFGETC